MSNIEQKLTKAKTTGRGTSIDHLVSQKLRMRRLMLGISQHELANSLKVSTQQIQKYENSTNRISSGKLYEIAVFLKISINYFFNQENNTINHLYAFAEDSEELDLNPHSIKSKDKNNIVDSSDITISNDYLYQIKSKEFLDQEFSNESSADFLYNFFNHKNYKENEKKEIINMLKEFIAIRDYKLRKSIINLIKNINNTYTH